MRIKLTDEDVAMLTKLKEENKIIVIDDNENEKIKELEKENKE